MAKKGNPFIVVRMTEEVLKMSLARSTPQGRKVESLSVTPINNLSDEEIIETIKDFTIQHGCVKARSLCVLSPGMVTTKNIEIPSVDPVEIKSIIDLQAGRHTPFSREEIIVGYINFGVYQKNYSKILLVIVNRNIVMRQMQICEAAGLVVEHVFFTPELKASFFSDFLKISSAHTSLGLIVVDKEQTYFTVMMNNTAIACRSLPVGMMDLIEPGELAQKKFLEELKRSIDSYQSEDIEKAPEQYFLIDAKERSSELESLLAQQLSIPINNVSYMDRCPCSSDVHDFLAQSSLESFFDVIAPHFISQEFQIDFLPEEIRMKRLIERQGREGILLGILAVIVLILIGANLMAKVSFKSAFLEKINEEHAQKEKQAQELEKISTKTRIVKGFLDNRLIPLNVIEELYLILAEEIYLRNLIIDEEGRITMEGTSDSMSQVFALVGKLEDSHLFKGVKTKSTTAKKERGKDVASFEIVFYLETAEEAIMTLEE